MTPTKLRNAELTGGSEEAVRLMTLMFLEKLGRLTPEDRQMVCQNFATLDAMTDEDERRCVLDGMIHLLTHGGHGRVVKLPARKPARPLRARAKYVGGLIRKLREQAGLTQEELAANAGIPQPHLSRLENAEHCANHFTLAKLAPALGVAAAAFDFDED